MINQNLIVFHSWPDFSDNPRALYDYVKKNSSFETFWVINDLNVYEMLSTQGLRCGLINDAVTQTMINSAHYIVSSSFDLACYKRKGQVYVSAWHGFGPKVIGFFSSAAVMDESFRELNVITTQCDLIALTSTSSKLLTSGMFAIDPRKAVITGFARNDYLFEEDGDKNLQLLFPEISFDRSKLVLYLPTMRRGLKDEGAQFDNNLFNYLDYDFDEIDSYLEKHDIYIIAKLHFADNDLVFINKSILPKRILLISNEDLLKHQLTIYHILNAFDVLVTDYSSIYSDFLLLDRPIVFSCPDYEQYKNDRGFIADDPRFMMPGAFVKTQKELINELGRILINNRDTYQQYRHFMTPFFHTYQDANSSCRLFDSMIQASHSSTQDCHKDYAYQYIDKNSPLSQYTGFCIADFYFDTGAGFNEDQKITIEYDLNNADIDGYLRMSVKCPYEHVQAIRFDPDRRNRALIQEFTASIEGKHIDYFCPNGIERDNEIVFLYSDPQIIFDLREISPVKKADSIVVEFKLVDLIYEGSTLLAASRLKNSKLENELNEAKDELKSVYNSKSWKITKPLRAIKRNKKL